MKMEVYQNLRDATKAVLREKIMVINDYIKKQERSQINNITLYLKKQNKLNPKLVKGNNKDQSGNK